jgi:hypothetical protein
MPRRNAYRLQARTSRTAAWRTVEKVWQERAAIFAGDVLARTSDAHALRVVCGSEVVEHWLLRDVAPTTRNREVTR